MKEYSDNWTKEEFTAFVMLHLANADLKISNSELFMIFDNVTEDEFKKIELVWSKSNDFECLQLIMEQRKKHFPEADGKEQLIEEITKLANADDQFSIYEENLIRALRKLL